MRTATDTVVQVLRDGGIQVGDAVSTDADGEDLAPPYVVVYPLGDARDGTLGSPWTDVTAGIQVTCVGRTRDQAEWLADRVFVLLTGHDGDWWVEVEPSGAVARDDTTGGPPLFYAYPRFAIHT